MPNILIEDLQPHPFNVKVYDAVDWNDPVDAAFLKSIQTYGIRQPIVYTRLSFNGGQSYGNYILSGHRRWEAAKQLNLKNVPIQIHGDSTGRKDTASHLAAELYILDANRQRQKSGTEIKKEIRELLRREVPLAAARKQAGKSDLSTKRHTGRTTEKISKQTGSSRRQVAAVQELERKALAGDKTAAAVLDDATPINSVKKTYQERIPKNPELIAALEKHVAKARELTKLFPDGEVARSAKADRFHLTIRNLTEEQVRDYVKP
jgi:ParB-like chromosome segregation protein Spo0J